MAAAGCIIRVKWIMGTEVQDKCNSLCGVRVHVVDKRKFIDRIRQVKSSHYYLYSAFINANCVKAALHQLDIKLGGFTSVLQYLDVFYSIPSDLDTVWIWVAMVTLE